MNVGDRIRKHRTRAGLSQRALAAKAGVSHGLVGQFENDRKTPGRETLVRLANVFGVAADYLVHGGDPLGGDLVVSAADEKLLVLQYRRVSTSQKKRLLDFIMKGAEAASGMQD